MPALGQRFALNASLCRRSDCAANGKCATVDLASGCESAEKTRCPFPRRLSRPWPLYKVDPIPGPDRHETAGRPRGDEPAFAGAREALRALLTWRRDVRRFQSRPLPEGLLEDLMQLAALAPSVGLSQPWRFVMVQSPEGRAIARGNFAAANAAALGGYEGERARLYAGLKLAGLDDAPAQLAVFAESDPQQGSGLGRASMPETLLYSVVIAVHTLWLAARVEGVGVGWVSILNPVELTAALDVPASWRLVAYLCIGYPVEAHDDPELERSGWEQRKAAPPPLLR